MLGPIDARQDGRSLPLSGPRRRALLARLLLARGQVVSVDQLLDDVWDAEPPAAASATLQSHVSQLRKVLGDGLQARGALAERGRPPGLLGVMRALQRGVDLLVGEFFEGLENVFGGRVDREHDHRHKDKSPEGTP